jgi:hypothetical protein
MEKADDAKIANGHAIDPDATAESINESTKSKFALIGEKSWSIDLSDDKPRGIVPSRCRDPEEEPLSDWAVFTTGPLLSPEECQTWIKKAEHVNLETGDFIFKTGLKGYERMKTGGRRHSSTTIIEDPHFAQRVDTLLQGPDSYVPMKLSNGMEFKGVRNTFLLSRYYPGQYFAPHFDGQLVAAAREPLAGSLSQFTCVLYLSDDFEGGATLYLPGTNDDNTHWSEVQKPAALRPKPGCGCIHRQGTVIHSGAKVLSGVKYIIQFGLMYQYANEDDDGEVKTAPSNQTDIFRWAA